MASMGDSDADSALKRLAAGQYDGVCISSVTLYQYREIAETLGIDFDVAALDDSSLCSKICIALPKNHTELGEQVNALLGKFRRDGTLKESAELWFGTDYPVDGALEANGIF